MSTSANDWIVEDFVAANPETRRAMEAAGRIAAASPMLDEFSGEEEADDESDVAIYGTFFIDDTELTLPARMVQEVVPYPANATSVPLCPEYVHGLFNLRGELIPIVDVATLLGVRSKIDNAQRRVAVVDCGDRYIGAVFDRTGEVLRVEADQQRRVHHAADAEVPPERAASGVAILDGVLLLDEGRRLVQVLSPELLGAVGRVPKSRKRTLGTEAALNAEPRHKAIVVRLGSTEFAFPMEDMLEIQSSLKIAQSPPYFAHSLGVVELRGSLRPVLDLRAALGLPRVEPPEFPLLVFLSRGDICLGVVIDALVDTVEYREGQRLPLPAMPHSRVGAVCKHVISTSAERNVLCISIENLLAADDIEGALRRAGLTVTEEVQADDEGADLDFFTFHVGSHRLSLPLQDVREIRKFPQELVDSTEAGVLIGGLMNLRGSIVPLINLDFRLQATARAPLANRLVLVIDFEGSSRGLIVDSVESIVRIRPKDVDDVTQMLKHSSNSKRALSCIHRALKPEGSSEALLVLDLGLVLEAE